MCEPKAKEIRPGEIEVTCSISGKPIVETNYLGMFCEDRCQMEESQGAERQMRDLMKGLCGVFPDITPESVDKIFDDFAEKYPIEKSKPKGER